MRCQCNRVILVLTRFIDPDDVPAVFVLITVLRRDAPADGFIPAFPGVGKRFPVFPVPEHAALRIVSCQSVTRTGRENQVPHDDLLIQVYGEGRGLYFIQRYIFCPEVDLNHKTVMDPDRPDVHILCQDKAVPVHKLSLQLRIQAYPVLLRIGMDVVQRLRRPGREGIMRTLGRHKVLIRRQRGSVVDRVFP